MEFQIKKVENEENAVISKEELSKRMLSWPDSYYQEREASVRTLLLQEANRLHLTPEDNEIRERLLRYRYPNLLKQENKNMDSFLKTWMEFRFLVENGGFFIKKKQKNARRVLEDMGYFAMESEQERRLLYQEIRHLGMLYISLCQEDSGYHSIALGFGRLSDEKLARKIANEFETVAVAAPEKIGMTKELSIWTQALMDALREIFPNTV